MIIYPNKNLSGPGPIVGTTGTFSGSVSAGTAALADGEHDGRTASRTVDVNATGAYAALYMASDGHYEEADADSATTMPCTAVALAAGTGAQTLLLNGRVRNDAWSWTPGGLVYVSCTAGGFTQTAPAGTGDQVQIVGYAEDANTLFFDPNLLLVEVP